MHPVIGLIAFLVMSSHPCTDSVHFRHYNNPVTTRPYFREKTMSVSNHESRAAAADGCRPAPWRRQRSSPVLRQAPVSPVFCRWERGTRYYLAQLDRDLFGEWVLTRIWGRKGTAQGCRVSEPVRDEAEGLRKLQAVAKRRKQHGYGLLQTAWPFTGKR